METFDFTIDSFLSLTNIGNDSSKLTELASHIMNNYCINNGQFLYHPIEIEFYVFKKGKHEDRHVYPRDNKKKGELFFHYSGMDICFESSLQNGCFGGVLIRALERIEKDKDGNSLYFGGPLVCANEVLNTAKRMCTLEEIHRHEEFVNAVQFGQRVGINKFENLKDNNNQSIEDDFYNKPYRFVRKDIQNTILEREDVSYDFKSQKRTDPCKSKRKYKIEKYIPKTKRT